MKKEHGGMDFKQLHGFNLAMLGKQSWCLMSDQDTMVAKVFKAKYFPLVALKTFATIVSMLHG